MQENERRKVLGGVAGKDSGVHRGEVGTWKGLPTPVKASSLGPTPRE